MSRKNCGILCDPSKIRSKRRSKFQLGGSPGGYQYPNYFVGNQGTPSSIPSIPNYRKGGRTKNISDREEHSFGDIVRGIGSGAEKAVDWVSKKAIPIGKDVVKGLHKASGYAKSLPIIGNIAKGVHDGTGKVRETFGFKKGGLTASHHKKIRELARQAGMTTSSHRKAIDSILKRARGGEVTKNHIAKLAREHGIHDPRQHHFLGKIVDFAKGAWNKGKNFIKSGHNFYNKHKDTIHKGIDIAGNITGKKDLAERAKKGLGKADSYVHAHRDQYGYKEGGHVGGRLNILKINKTRV